MKKNILATAMLAVAMSMGLGDEKVGIKKATSITRNWKDSQNKDDRLSALRKAEAKRERKRLKKMGEKT